MRQLTVLTAVHGRHALAKRMVLHAKQQVPAGWRVNVLAVVSPEDAIVMGPECDLTGVAWTVCDNLPVSHKWQSGLSAVECVFPLTEAVMILGSDDFASREYVEAACASLDAGAVDPFGQWRVWMLNTETREIGFFEMIDRRKTLGAGRIFPRAALEKLDWTLWTDALNAGLDNHCTARCEVKGVPIEPVTLPGVVVDVKSPEGNIHCWQKFMQWGRCPVTRFSQIIPAWQSDEFLRENGLEALLNA